jgi:hypothetical protein
VSEVQVVFWRDIPAQVKARESGERAARALTSRFQEAIDVAAMRAGLTETDDYLGEWRATAWEPRDGSPEAVAERRAAEIEAEYSDERLRQLAENGGRTT